MACIHRMLSCTLAAALRMAKPLCRLPRALDLSDRPREGCENRRNAMTTIRPIAAAASLALACAPAVAQDWPTRPLTMVVPLCRGWSDRHRGAPARGAPVGSARATSHHRERRRRRRHERRGPRGQGAAGRLPVPARQCRYTRPQPDALQAAALQFSDRLRAGRAPRRPADGDGLAHEFSRRQSPGLHRLRQGQPSHDAVCVGRHRFADAPRLCAAQFSDRV